MNSRKVYVTYANQKPYSKEYNFIINLLKTLHIFYYLDLGFFTHKSLKFRLISYLFFTGHCLAGFLIILELYTDKISLDSSWTIPFFLNYLILTLLSTFYKRGKIFMGLYEILREIDAKLQVDFLYNHTELKLILVILFIFVERLLVVGYYCIMSFNEYCLNSKWDIYAFVILSACLDIYLACYTFVLYSLYLRLLKISHMLMTNDDVNQYLRLYKTIVDAVEKYKTAFDPVFMLMLIFNVWQIMGTMYHLLKELRIQHNGTIFMTMGVEYCYLFAVLVFTIAPAVTVEMLTTQAEKIRSTLHNKKLALGVQHSESLTRFIQYVEARPCRFHVWKLIPLGADLPGMVLSFCITYFIVIIQFTNPK